MNGTRDKAILNMLQSRIGSADWSKWQMQRWSFYDYIRYPVAGTTQLTFFATPMGGVDPNSNLSKTLEQTNVQKSRGFGQVYFVIAQIRTHLNILPKGRQVTTISTDANVITDTYKALAAALLRLSGQGVLNMKIGQKDYFDIPKPFLRCPPGMGVDIDQHAASVTTSYWFQQNPDARDVYAMTPPQMIEPEQTFELTVDFPNATSPSISAIVDGVNPAVDVGVIFDGYIARPVQ